MPRLFPSAVKRECLPGVEHRQSRDLSNRCESSHRPPRQWESPFQQLDNAHLV
jgi:putative transposase